MNTENESLIASYVLNNYDTNITYILTLSTRKVKKLLTIFSLRPAVYINKKAPRAGGRT